MFGRLDASNVHCSVVVCLVDGWYFLSSPPSLPRLLSLSLFMTSVSTSKQAQATSATDNRKRQEKKAKRRHMHHQHSRSYYSTTVHSDCTSHQTIEMKVLSLSILATATISASAFTTPSYARASKTSSLHAKPKNNILTEASAILTSLTVSTLLLLNPININAANAAEGGASNIANSKITTGGASTLQSGRTITITRGVNLDQSDFSNQNLKGVAFQQSIVRNANFKGTNLFGASFFDATLDGSNFEGADMTQVNLEMAQLSRSNLKNAIVREMYVGGT